MEFQVRTDNHIKNSEALSDGIRALVEGNLNRRFSERLRRVEVYLQDVNAQKHGIDKRCSIEAHLAGLQPVAVHGLASNIDEAVSGAVDKLVRTLDRTLGRLHDHNGRVSMSGEET
jgi:ribosome-associated translation inhibitor RaiA